jgi:hypothetical protein
MKGEREREQKLLAAGVKRDSGGNNVTIHISSDNLIALCPIEFSALSGNGCASDVQTPAPILKYVVCINVMRLDKVRNPR